MSGCCDQCGREMQSRREGSTQGLFCPACGWRAVTTYIPAIDLDATEYEVRVSDADSRNAQHIKAVAAVSVQSFLAVRALLQQSNPVVFKGQAADVKRALDVLTAAGLGYQIHPPYPYLEL